MNDIEFKDKFIGFVDILGFKKMVEAAEAGIGMSLSELLEIIEKLRTLMTEKISKDTGQLFARKVPTSNMTSTSG